MSPALQAMLLRALEDGTYTRVGESKPRRSDFRLVCATCRYLPGMVDRGDFRSDLFYRIHGAAITLPPVRTRSDRTALAEALLAALASEAGLEVPSLSEDARAHLARHDWPGNVRELKSALRYALYLADDGVIGASSFPEILVGREPPPNSPRTRRDAEAAALDSALEKAGGNLTVAAKTLGVSRSTLYRMIERRGR